VSGWEALIEILQERYGLEVDKAAITIFICVVPVVLDAFVKLWVRMFSSLSSPQFIGLLVLYISVTGHAQFKLNSVV
jgi:CemA family